MCPKPKSIRLALHVAAMKADKGKESIPIVRASVQSMVPIDLWRCVIDDAVKYIEARGCGRLW